MRTERTLVSSVAGTTTYQGFSFYQIIYQHQHQHEHQHQHQPTDSTPTTGSASPVGRNRLCSVYSDTTRRFQACLLAIARLHSVNQRARRSVHHEPLSGSCFSNFFPLFLILPHPIDSSYRGHVLRIACLTSISWIIRSEQFVVLANR